MAQMHQMSKNKHYDVEEVEVLDMLIHLVILFIDLVLTLLKVIGILYVFLVP